MADQFCLRWNNFHSNIVSALDSLKCSEDLVDVTLTCEGRNIKAHKVILSACSPYFRNVFKENPCQHPVIILKDVLAEDIVSLLSYMYQGEVFIEESKLSSFLHTAALLQVKGLTGVTHQNRESFATVASPISTNKLYTQLTISSRQQIPSIQKDTKPSPAVKKRRSSTSDKPVDVNCLDVHKKPKTFDTNDANLRNLSPSAFDNRSDNAVPYKNESEHKCDDKTETVVNANGKLKTSKGGTQNSETVQVKTERIEDNESASSDERNNTEEETDSIPDYENSMLARSLLSGINPSKSDINANNSSPKSKMPGIHPVHFTSKKSPPKTLPSSDDQNVKSEKSSPKSEIDYEPEILLSEHSDGVNTDFSQEHSQALMLLAGMSNVSVLSQGASTSSHQSNHAAICGDCPHCGMKYSNQSALKYHVRLMHSDLTNRLCCYLCPRSFTMRETFKEHMWTTHGQRN